MIHPLPLTPKHHPPHHSQKKPMPPHTPHHPHTNPYHPHTTTNPTHQRNFCFFKLCITPPCLIQKLRNKTVDDWKFQNLLIVKNCKEWHKYISVYLASWHEFCLGINSQIPVDYQGVTFIKLFTNMFHKFIKYFPSNYIFLLFLCPHF